MGGQGSRPAARGNVEVGGGVYVQTPSARAAFGLGSRAFFLLFVCLFLQAHVVVGTVEKVLALVRRGSLRLDALQLLIIDEADEVVREEGLKNVLE